MSDLMITGPARSNTTMCLIVLGLVFGPVRVVAWLAVLAFLAAQTPANWPQLPGISRAPTPFTEPCAYPDGLVVNVTRASSGLLTEVPYSDNPFVQHGDPYTIITVELRNGSSKTVQAWFVGRATYGPKRHQAPRFATRALTDLNSVQMIAPGETSYPYSLGFLIPPDAHDDVQFELNIDPGTHRTAIFAGSLDSLLTTR